MCTKDCCLKMKPGKDGLIVNDCLIKQIECLWKDAFKDATILPNDCFGSCHDNVLTLTHTTNPHLPAFSINGLKTYSPLNNAFYSAEISCHQWINLYQISIPNKAGTEGCKSTTEIYTEALVKLGISVDNEYLPWKGSCPAMLRIGSKAIGMDPIQFSRKQIAAVKTILCYCAKN